MSSVVVGAADWRAAAGGLLFFALSVARVQGCWRCRLAALILVGWTVDPSPRGIVRAAQQWPSMAQRGQQQQQRRPSWPPWPQRSPKCTVCSRPATHLALPAPQQRYQQPRAPAASPMAAAAPAAPRLPTCATGHTRYTAPLTARWRRAPALAPTTQESSWDLNTAEKKHSRAHRFFGNSRQRAQLRNLFPFHPKPLCCPARPQARTP